MRANRNEANRMGQPMLSRNGLMKVLKSWRGHLPIPEMDQRNGVHDMEKGEKRDLSPANAPLANLGHLDLEMALEAVQRPTEETVDFGSNTSQRLVHLPKPRHGRYLRNLRWSIFSVYRRLSLLVLVTNIAWMIYLLVQQGSLHTALMRCLTPVAANIMFSVLVRQDHVINLLFYTFGRIPKRLPLRLRRLAAKLYHLGGIHSGCGVAALLWFLLYNVSIVQRLESTTASWSGVLKIVLTGVLDVLLTSMIVFSVPSFRTKHHDTWERVHRFAGWIATLLFWLYLVTSVVNMSTSASWYGFLRIFGTQPVLYMLITTAGSLILPWLSLRRVSVRAERLSDHAVRLFFDYAGLRDCTSPRFATNPLRDWHAFAAVPNMSKSLEEHPSDTVSTFPAMNTEGFSTIVSNAGDWTSSVIASPPSYLWTRGTPSLGALYMAHLFSRMVLVATGSGIAPILGLLQTKDPGITFRILWSTRDPEAVYAPYFLSLLRRADPEAVVIDTARTGRPKMVQEAYKLYVEAQAEAIFVISNARVTRQIVYGLEIRGIPVFAPIFDS